jgi:predicted ribonuclease YlaK
MNRIRDTAPSTLDRIKKSLVGLRMARSLEVLDAAVARLEKGDANALEALDHLLAEELSIRETRRIKAAVMMARLTTIKTLSGFDFTFQPSLDKNRILALAELGFIERNEVVHLLGPPGTGKSHLAIALGVGDLHAAVFRFPLVEGRPRDPVTPANVGRRAARLLLPQDRDDLLVRKPAATHRSSPRVRKRALPQ